MTIFLSSGRRGSNPPPPAWKASALPNELLPLINGSRIVFRILPFAIPNLLWGEEDSNLRSRKTTDLQSVPFGHSGIPPEKDC